jgi:hypothetical protein
MFFVCLSVRLCFFLFFVTRFTLWLRVLASVCVSGNQNANIRFWNFFVF